ncbi:MAG: hypothetical protein M1816_006798 [Peltula sp. TS41687]|nr:MAG: hypothetical protein M1816_006798 [Peltula sp. TS41687]
MNIFSTPGAAPDVLNSILPNPKQLEQARKALYYTLPKAGVGLEAIQEHLTNDIAPGLNRASQSPNYYGFVTGGVTPAAAFADGIVTKFDQNVQVHLPEETIATVVEDAALKLLLSLFDLDPQKWVGRTLTTGATASNLQGLACGREYVIEQAARRVGLDHHVSVAELGIVSASKEARIDHINILTTVPHSSLTKAASVLGFGRAAVKDVGLKDGMRWRFDLALVEDMLRLQNTASIVVVSCGEVNTGRFATAGYDDFLSLRNLCDQYGAWIHVDGAFGLFARLLPLGNLDTIRQGVEGVELADSITGDAHKLLNVPYDCGFFFSRHSMQQVFQNTNATYLNSTANITDVVSPLNISIENSRRFRAMPVYATLVACGRDGYLDMLERQIRLATQVALFLWSHSEDFELLPDLKNEDVEERVHNVFIIVLFRARDERLNHDLVKRINAANKIYVSGTIWDGMPATRIAIANWQVMPNRDLDIIKDVLNEVLRQWRIERDGNSR